MAPPVKLHMISNASASQANPTEWPGGIGVFDVVGTFGGATVSLTFRGADEATYLPAGAATTLTSPGAGVFYLPKCLMLVTVTGGAPSALYAEAGLVEN